MTELIRDGYLLGTKCYAPNRERTRNGKVRRGIAGDLVESWVQYGENLPTVLFCSRVQYSQEAVAEFKALRHRGGRMSMLTRRTTCGMRYSTNWRLER